MKPKWNPNEAETEMEIDLIYNLFLRICNLKLETISLRREIYCKAISVSIKKKTLFNKLKLKLDFKMHNTSYCSYMIGNNLSD